MKKEKIFYLLAGLFVAYIIYHYFFKKKDIKVIDMINGNGDPICASDETLQEAHCIQAPCPKICMKNTPSFKIFPADYIPASKGSC